MTYKELRDKHQEESNAFPMMFAFSNKQFEEGMIGLGLKPTDTDKIYSLNGTGGYYRKSDAPAFREMLTRHEKELSEAIAGDLTGNGFIFDMFNYELGNHEYCITYDVEPTLECLGLDAEDFNNNPRLQWGLKKACKRQKHPADRRRCLKNGEV